MFVKHYHVSRNQDLLTELRKRKDKRKREKEKIFLCFLFFTFFLFPISTQLLRVLVGDGRDARFFQEKLLSTALLRVSL